MNNKDPLGSRIVCATTPENGFDMPEPSPLVREKPTLKNHKKENGTLILGLTGSVAFGIQVEGSIGLALDKNGNMGLLVSLAGGGGTPSASVGFFGMYTNAPTIYKLREHSIQAGGSIINIGMENTSLITDSPEPYYGGLISVLLVGAPIPVEGHANWGYTWVIDLNFINKWFNRYSQIPVGS